MNVKNYVTPKSASSTLNVHVQTLRRWAEAGVIDFVVTPGGQYRYAVEDYIERHSTKETSETNGMEKKLPEGEKSG